MNDFTASNGVVIRRHETIVGIRRSVEDTEPVRVPGYAQPDRVQTYFDPRQWDAIVESVLAEVDERLGRWRSKVDPAWTAVVDTAASLVYFRHDGGLHEFSVHLNGTGISRWTRELQAVAREYLDAHSEPKPWDAAKEGDIWALTGAGGLEQPWRRHEGKWISCTPSLRTYDAAHAIAGRCIWSEASDGD